MTRDERSALISKYRNGFAQVTAALRNIGPEELDFKSGPGKWSCREVIHHLADAETINGHRLRRLLAEFSPYVQGYDQDEYARRLRYSQRPIELALDAFRVARETTAQLFEFMTEEDWKRAGEHSDAGPYSVETWLKSAAAHAEGHAGQILRNREEYKRRSSNQ